jgi:hypothetical protein
LMRGISAQVGETRISVLTGESLRKPVGAGRLPTGISTINNRAAIRSVKFSAVWQGHRCSDIRLASIAAY